MFSQGFFTSVCARSLDSLHVCAGLQFQLHFVVSIIATWSLAAAVSRTLRDVIRRWRHTNSAGMLLLQEPYL